MKDFLNWLYGITLIASSAVLSFGLLRLGAWCFNADADKWTDWTGLLFLPVSCLVFWLARKIEGIVKRRRKNNPTSVIVKLNVEQLKKR